MSGRDSLPHFPAPSKSQSPQQQPPSRPPPPKQQSPQGKMYQPPYQQQQPTQGYQPTSSVPGAYPGSPVGGYQVGPPGTAYGSAYAPQQQQAQYGGVSGGAAYSQPRGSLQAPPGIDPQLYSLFKAADTTNKGELSEQELSRALVNGDWTPFDPKTVKLMVKMFDVDHSGTIGLEEFVGLWKYLDQWRGLFKRFDTDGSGAIDRNEFANALSAFGYRLSDNFITLLFASYDKRGDGQIGFDMFVQGMVTVKTLTEVFKNLDTDRDGFITIGFEQFLEIILRQR